MIFLIISYVLEIVIFFIWYRKILTKEVNINGTIRKICNIISLNKGLFAHIIFDYFKYDNDDMIIFKNRIQKLRINLFTVIVYISYFVFAPILLDFIELNINIVWQKLLSLVLVIGINIKCYFDYTQNTILIINDFLDVLNFMNSNPNFIVENKKDISVLKETFNRIKWYQWGYWS